MCQYAWMTLTSKFNKAGVYNISLESDDIQGSYRRETNRDRQKDGHTD